MTTSEKRFLILGLLGGAALAAVLYAGLRVLGPTPEMSASSPPQSERMASYSPAEQPAEKIFRVVMRRGAVCCPAGGVGTVGLALDNSRREVAEWDYQLAFEWTVQ